MPVTKALPRSQRNRYVVVALALILVIQLVAVTISGFVVNGRACSAKSRK